MAIQPVKLEVIIPMLSTMELGCGSCRMILGDVGLRANHAQSCIDDFPQDWKESGARLSSWIDEISSLYRHRLRVELVDALSPQGIWRQLRYGLRRFPAFVVDGRDTVAGWEPHQVTDLIDRRIQELG